ncbi:NAD(P)-binding domain-containing protein [Pseudoalteromonas sp. OOF1S-7]|uniref:NAD(P)-binding domain-containing protein n=1 Tax=Pseudoalteromonas sp. OOF1S-7 TaxID=2917757 RepID=UPI001EF45297|nr:NAD(P)-binding domain-containing protein [Pseudoalteromonas sp. OOF1S-7]MCG7535563.1 NAD(P)-binding domain-containing protein [Pseudoalteromonas sp. OOF1S-7]
MKPIEEVIIIGAGPIGLAAAARLVEKGIRPTVIEKGHTVGAAILKWGHVSLFTPWSYMVDEAVANLLTRHGWSGVDANVTPTGRQVVEQYLQPAAELPELAEHIRYSTEVFGVSKAGISKHTTLGRDSARFVVHCRNEQGIQVLHSDAVIDASGTWSTPNPLGLDGLPVPGELANQESVYYGIPDILGTQRNGFARKRTLVVGAGHSAMNIVLDLLRLQTVASGTEVIWGLRKDNIDKLLGKGINDKVPARRQLGLAAKEAMEHGALKLVSQLDIKELTRTEHGLDISALAAGTHIKMQVDNIIVATGFSPDLEMLRELRLDLDHIVEAPSRLAPLIDPNLHSCGSVRTHGVDELSHHDRHFYIVGMKSYGRAPTFLMLTGYEQVRSIVESLAGNDVAARSSQLRFPGAPETQQGACCS